MRRALIALVVAGAFASPAQAMPPVLTGLSQTDRHPAATFRAAGADYVTIRFATSPAQATDGSFLTENVKYSDSFTTDEIQAGLWTGESQLDPGHYWAMLDADDFGCPEAPDCTSGHSNVMELEIPVPVQRYIGSVDVFRYVRVIYLHLTVTPLGDRLPYRVCWQRANRRQLCVSSAVAGYSWSADASDTVRVRLRGMSRMTTFSWYVGQQRVASRRVSTVPAR
jgi:hypothetical protein